MAVALHPGAVEAMPKAVYNAKAGVTSGATAAFATTGTYGN